MHSMMQQHTGMGNMRYMAMQVLTWGTIGGAIVSALMLAALDRSSHKYFGAVPLESSWPGATTAASRARGLLPSANGAASAPRAKGG
jgi:hypothetical protein